MREGGKKKHLKIQKFFHISPKSNEGAKKKKTFGYFDRKVMRETNKQRFSLLY